jgi:circadian clock protein KaiC
MSIEMSKGKEVSMQKLDKISLGIEGFDHITNGGLKAKKTAVICGSAGSGKTLFSIEAAYRSAKEFNNKAIYITFEERTQDIMDNVKSLGWDLSELVAEKKLLFIDLSPESIAIEESGLYDFSALIAQIRMQIERMGAGFVVLDSLGSLFDRFKNRNIIRREIFNLIEHLRDLNVTSLITTERDAEYGQTSRSGVEEFVSDSVIIMRNVLKDEQIRRTIQISKVRGCEHQKGEFPFTIGNDGIKIMPLSATNLLTASSSTRTSLGNEVLDSMSGGGVFDDSLVLVSGPTGGGKTLLAATFAAQGCQQKDRVLMLAYEESREQLIRNANSWGKDFVGWEDQGNLRIVSQYPEAMGIEDHLVAIKQQITDFKPKRLVIDSISAMERITGIRNFREFVIGLTAFIKGQGICAFLTSTSPSLAGGESITDAHISTITDAIAVIRYVEINGVMRRGIAIIKMRGSQHEKEIREFEIGGTGITVGEPFKNIENIILGMPRSSGSIENEQLASMFGRDQ